MLGNVAYAFSCWYNPSCWLCLIFHPFWCNIKLDSTIHIFYEWYYWVISMGFGSLLSLLNFYLTRRVYEESSLSIICRAKNVGKLAFFLQFLFLDLTSTQSLKPGKTPKNGTVGTISGKVNACRQADSTDNSSSHEPGRIRKSQNYRYRKQSCAWR